MARNTRSKNVKNQKLRVDWLLPFRVILWFVRPFITFAFSLLLVATIFVGIFRWVNPPLTYLMYSEYNRLGVIFYEWRDLEDMSTYIPLAIAASEDANFCDHNGFDIEAIKSAMEDGSGRGASTITQQVAKNVFLWPERSWLRKGLEAGVTVLIESLWSKRRIMEVYLNVAEFDEGIFGVERAVSKHFRYDPSNLRLADAARLAVVLPNPRERSASNLSFNLRRRASQVSIGATTLRAEGRADCFLPYSSP